MSAGQAIIFDTGYSRKTISRSGTIDDTLSDQLLKMAPSSAVLVNHLKGCLEFSRLNADCLVLSRTVYARRKTELGIEQGTFSRFVVFSSQQLAVFDNNPAMLAFYLQSEGLLHFHGNLKAKLGEVRWPEKGISNLSDSYHAFPRVESARILRAIEIHNRAAIIGVTNPSIFLAGMLSHFPPQRRLATRFSIGTMFSDARPFELLVFPEFNDGIKRKLVNSQIRTISGCRETVSTP